MTDEGFPTEIYFVTGVHPKGRLYGNTGPLKLSIKGHIGSGTSANGVKVWKFNAAGGWLDVTSEFLDEEGRPKW